MLATLYAQGYIIPTRLNRKELTVLADGQVKRFFSPTELEMIDHALCHPRLNDLVQYYWEKFSASKVLPEVTAIELTEKEQRCVSKALEFFRVMQLYIFNTYQGIRHLPLGSASRH
jgi:hypothetical protein